MVCANFALTRVPLVINTQKMRVVIFIVYILHVILIYYSFITCSQMEHVYYLHRLTFELVGIPDMLREFYA